MQGPPEQLLLPQKYSPELLMVLRCAQGVSCVCSGKEMKVTPWLVRLELNPPG